MLTETEREILEKATKLSALLPPGLGQSIRSCLATLDDALAFVEKIEIRDTEQTELLGEEQRQKAIAALLIVSDEGAELVRLAPSDKEALRAVVELLRAELPRDKT